MFIGAYFALCGFQYLIVVAISLILLRRKLGSASMLKFLGRYTIAALGVSLLGLALFIFISNPIGSLSINFPRDLSDPDRVVSSLIVILIILFGLAGVTAPVWVLLLVRHNNRNYW